VSDADHACMHNKEYTNLLENKITMKKSLCILGETKFYISSEALNITGWQEIK
jgi:hypothetical protein